MIYEKTTELIAALRSGKYKQGTGRLRQDDRYCCLGVACDIANLPWSENHCLGEQVFLPREAKKYFGFRRINGAFLKDIMLDGRSYHSLVELNDMAIPFSRIADVIVEYWREL